MKTQIKTGLTNTSFREDDKFIQDQIFTGFNHNIDYKLLKKFSFVPKLISNKNNQLIWEFIEGNQPTKSDENLEIIAKHLVELHNSNLSFPNSNHRDRVNEYLRIINEKKLNDEFIKNTMIYINKVLDLMKNTVPLHNDLWLRNMVKNNNGQIFIVDWEYATMGNKHFDLAYFIESAELNSEEETVFLKNYNDYDYNEIQKMKVLVNFLVVTWGLAQKTIPFDVTPYKNKANKLISTINW
ncbi:phosphotransferase [Mycoplasma sp. Mirounga ES2805-ORL]|uniref:phosphotransferase n=1 Tax=Mycoplasma sp. Mirounga ES2805-ORL TaxID=754514 RepID=UPI00197B5D1A|nr:phosphotransferase [Mycoplasma sp. Mirounga ES2805-ORL]QSF13855.1 phosphotransferase [Mycoplasma sp. Mirounga ES2805-ORL]